MDMMKFVRYGLIGGVFIIPFLSFVVTPSLFFPFVTGKAFAFRVLVEVLVGLWALLAIYNSNYRPRFSYIVGALIAFVSLLLLADLLAENPFKAFWSNFERMEGFVSIIHLTLYFFVVSSVLQTEKLWDAFWKTSVGASVLMGVYGLFQLAGFITINQGGARLDGTFGNATYLAVYMLFHMFFAGLLLSRAKVRWQQFIYAGIIAFQFFILVATGTRGAMLGVLAGALLTAILITIFENGWTSTRKISAGILAGVVLLVGGFMAIKDTSFVRDSDVLVRFATISLSAGQTRFEIWDMALYGIKERPLLGWGQEGFNFVFNKYYKAELYTQEPWFDRVHNTYLDWFIAGGILTLLSYLALYGAALFALWKTTALSLVEKSVLVGLLAGYAFHELFVFDNLLSYVFFFTVLAYIHAKATENKESVWQGSINKSMQYIFAGLVLVLLAGSLWFVNIRPIQAAHALLQGISLQDAGLEQNLEFLKKANEYNTIGRQESAEQMVLVAERVARLEVPDETKVLFRDTARKYMQDEIDRNPNDARILALMASMLNNFNLRSEATPYIEQAIKLSPKKQSLRSLLGLMQIVGQNPTEGLKTLKESFELAPSNEESRILYAVGALYAGQSALAHSILVEYFGTDIVPNNDRLLRAYYDNGQSDKVVETWEARVNIDPNNLQNRVSLAAAYSEVGRKQEAVAIIQEIIEKVPNFKAQGEAIIQQILNQ